MLPETHFSRMASLKPRVGDGVWPVLDGSNPESGLTRRLKSLCEDVLAPGPVSRQNVSMQVTVEIPDDLAPSLAPGQDPSRAVLQTLGLEAYRLRRITGYQLRTLLGLPSRWDLHALLNERQIDMYTVEDFEQDLATIEEFRKKRKA